jgi:uncharacterized protein (TIGR04141 family)
MARQPSTTRRTTLWALRPTSQLASGVQEKYRNNGEFEMKPVQVAGQSALLVQGSIDNPEAKWSQTLSAYTGQPVSLGNRTAAALLLMPRANRVLALSYGMGWILLDQSQVEQGFGLRYAVRALDAGQVRQVTRHLLEQRAQIDRNSVPSGQRVEDFAIEEYGEVISRLVGRSGSTNNPSFSKTGRAYFSLSGSDSLALPIGRTAADLLGDLDEIESVIDNGQPVEDLRFVEQLRHLKGKDTRVPELEALLGAALEPQTDARLALAYPFERDDEHGEAQAYRIKMPGEKTQVVDDLALEQLRQPLAGVAEADRLRTLAKATVQALGDDTGDTVIGRAIPANKWITAEITLNGQQYFYRQGRWYEVGAGYLEYLRRQVDEILRQPTSVSLPDWNRDEDEKDFNARASAESGCVLLDRRLVRTKTHARGIELCDLLGEDNELIHVKQAGSSAPLSHLFAQGAVSAEALSTDPEARARLREIVAEQRPDKPLPEDWQPDRVVYAMALDRKITSETLFTFSQVVLVRYSQRLARMRVKVAILPISYSDEASEIASSEEIS